MPRKPRVDVGGLVYHVCNRANLRARVHFTEEDYQALERATIHAARATKLRILSFCFMPNHWHFVVWTRNDGELASFFRRLALVHTQQWHERHGTTGSGHLYQARYRSFIVQTNERLLHACRYVERNALTAKLVQRAEDWPFGSAFHRLHRTALNQLLEDTWPKERPANWLDVVNESNDERVWREIQHANLRSVPYGDEQWTKDCARSFGITLRTRQSRVRDFLNV